MSLIGSISTPIWMALPYTGLWILASPAINSNTCLNILATVVYSKVFSFITLRLTATFNKATAGSASQALKEGATFNKYVGLALKELISKLLSFYSTNIWTVAQTCVVQTITEVGFRVFTVFKYTKAFAHLEQSMKDLEKELVQEIKQGSVSLHKLEEELEQDARKFEQDVEKEMAADGQSVEGKATLRRQGCHSLEQAALEAELRFNRLELGEDIALHNMAEIIHIFYAVVLWHILDAENRTLLFTCGCAGIAMACELIGDAVIRLLLSKLDVPMEKITSPLSQSWTVWDVVVGHQHVVLMASFFYWTGW
eukprot:gnl/TRDRNA2_/TRDRNA2_175736_c0_seq1.p1 gnl/TRDRNA2_/TRDRNA2_175736_c0~~gnl/TRDRNA2_/TRDRNA2_175736_c0_seq1.p1  ORF type:complete len:311 (-),score=41.19 gnl/TRDRNA2_/TRDRNA2_175736_c0_seq1:148-1080(-)